MACRKGEGEESPCISVAAVAAVAVAAVAAAVVVAITIAVIVENPKKNLEVGKEACKTLGRINRT